MIIFVFIFYVCGVLIAYLCTTCVPIVLRDQKNLRFSGTEVTCGCELPSGYWETNLDPQEEQLVLSSTEPSLQPSFSLFWLVGLFLRRGF